MQSDASKQLVAGLSARVVDAAGSVGAQSSSHYEALLGEDALAQKHALYHLCLLFFGGAIDADEYRAERRFVMGMQGSAAGTEFGPVSQPGQRATSFAGTWAATLTRRLSTCYDDQEGKTYTYTWSIYDEGLDRFGSATWGVEVVAANAHTSFSDFAGTLVDGGAELRVSTRANQLRKVGSTFDRRFYVDGQAELLLRIKDGQIVGERVISHVAERYEDAPLVQGIFGQYSRGTPEDHYPACTAIDSVVATRVQ